MMDIFIAVAELFKSIGPWALILLLLILIGRIVFDEDLAAKYRGKIFKLLYSISGKLDHEKKYISNDVKAQLNLARRKMHFGKEILPRAVEVAWVQGANGTISDIREGEFVIRLDPSAEQRQNIAIMAMAVVKRTTLLGIRHSIDPPLQQAIDLNMTRNIMKVLKNRPALDWFITNILLQEVNSNENIKKRHDQIALMDERGFFTRVFLVELESFSREVHGRPPRPYMAGEIDDFVTFINAICQRKPGQEIPLQFERAHIRVGMIIVAKTAKILDSIEPYIRAFNINLQRKINSIYVLVYKKEWLGEVDPETHKLWQNKVKELDKEIEKTVVMKEYDTEFDFVDADGHKQRARCIKYKVPDDVI